MSVFSIVVPDFRMWASKCSITVPFGVFVGVSDQAKMEFDFLI